MAQSNKFTGKRYVILNGVSVQLGTSYVYAELLSRTDSAEILSWVTRKAKETTTVLDKLTGCFVTAHKGFVVAGQFVVRDGRVGFGGRLFAGEMTVSDALSKAEEYLKSAVKAKPSGSEKASNVSAKTEVNSATTAASVPSPERTPVANAINHNTSKD
jgi:hypothetical protein